MLLANQHWRCSAMLSYLQLHNAEFSGLQPTELDSEKQLHLKNSYKFYNDLVQHATQV